MSGIEVKGDALPGGGIDIVSTTEFFRPKNSVAALPSFFAKKLSRFRDRIFSSKKSVTKVTEFFLTKKLGRFSDRVFSLEIYWEAQKRAC